MSCSNTATSRQKEKKVIRALGGGGRRKPVEVGVVGVGGRTDGVGRGSRRIKGEAPYPSLTSNRLGEGRRDPPRAKSKRKVYPSGWGWGERGPCYSPRAFSTTEQGVLGRCQHQMGRERERESETLGGREAFFSPSPSLSLSLLSGHNHRTWQGLISTGPRPEESSHKA